MCAVRLQKYLSDCGIASRRKSEVLISEGKVSVNGITTTEMGVKINPESDIIECNGERVIPANKYIYILLNKPSGVVSTCSDDKGRTCVTDLIEGVSERVYPVGRLDYNSEGLIILTNDGDVTNKLTHPSHMISKKYLAVINSVITEKEAEKLSKGVNIGGYITAPAYFKILDAADSRSEVLCVIKEGKNRQIRRMFEAIGKDVLYLKRVSFGEIRLGNLKKGKWRYLSPDEIGYLKGL